MRREELYLRDVIEAADHITAFLANADFPAFRESELIRSAIVQKLAVMGEAAARLSDEMRARHCEVPWPRLVAFRNILVHAYFGIDWDVVWQAATREVPALRTQVASILHSEFGAR